MPLSDEQLDTISSDLREILVSTLASISPGKAGAHGQAGWLAVARLAYELLRPIIEAERDRRWTDILIFYGLATGHGDTIEDIVSECLAHQRDITTRERDEIWTSSLTCTKLEHVRSQPQWKHPRFWAGWVLTGLMD